MAKLSNLGIKNLKPAEKSYKVFDGRGLYLEVYPGGSKIWRLKYRLDGRESRVSLGPLSEVGLAEARDKIGLLRTGLRAGRRPSEKRPKQVVFKDLAEEWFNKNYNGQTKRLATIAKVGQLLKGTILPAIGSYRIEDISRDVMINNLLKPIEAFIPKSKASLNICINIFDYAILKGIININIPSTVKGFIPEHKGKHVPSLVNNSDIVQLIIDIHNLPDGVHKRLLLLFSYLFVRPMELLNADWDEIDLNERIWKIKPERMKSNRLHVVPLARQPAEIFASLPKTHPKVFHNERTNKIVAKRTLAQILDRLGYKGRMSLHGFRALASTTLNERGFDSDCIELQLAHVGRGVRAVYNFADHLSERRSMMQAWADYLDSLAASAAPDRDPT